MSGYELVASMLEGGGKLDIATLGVPEDFFTEDELILYRLVKSHAQKYGTIPKVKTIADKLPDLELPDTDEPPGFYLEKLRQRYTYETLVSGMHKARECLKKTGVDFDPYKAVDVLKEVITHLLLAHKSSEILDFREAHDLVKADYIAKQKGLSAMSYKLGWPSLDEMAGGITAGDVFSIVGRPAMGKTWLLMRAMQHIWRTRKVPVMLVSMEMPILPIAQRMTALHTHMNLTNLMKAEFSSKGKSKVFTELKGLAEFDVPMWLVDGNMTATVPDIWSLAHQLQPEVILIDGAYLMQHANKRLGRWDRVTETAEQIKQMLATDFKKPVVASYQLNRQAAVKQKKNPQDTGLEDIGYTDAIGQLSSVVLALLQEESVETKLRRLVTIMKGRSGERGEFRIRWEFDFMNFDEVLESSENLDVLSYV